MILDFNLIFRLLTGFLFPFLNHSTHYTGRMKFEESRMFITSSLLAKCVASVFIFICYKNQKHLCKIRSFTLKEFDKVTYKSHRRCLKIPVHRLADKRP